MYAMHFATWCSDAEYWMNWSPSSASWEQVRPRKLDAGQRNSTDATIMTSIGLTECLANTLHHVRVQAFNSAVEPPHFRQTPYASQAPGSHTVRNKSSTSRKPSRSTRHTKYWDGTNMPSKWYRSGNDGTLQRGTGARTNAQYNLLSAILPSPCLPMR
jgi:hypothetical protein